MADAVSGGPYRIAITQGKFLFTACIQRQGVYGVWWPEAIGYGLTRGRAIRNAEKEYANKTRRECQRAVEHAAREATQETIPYNPGDACP